MRVLVTGASGMLGATLCKLFEKGHDVYATGNSGYDCPTIKYKTFDFETGNYKSLIKWSNPEVIILSGAITNGNYCEKHPELAFKVNGISVKNFISATTENVKIIYISTDAVFPSKIHLAKETDCVCPESVYGKAKELGEFFLKNSNRKFCIIRTTIVGLNINPNKKGFVEWIIESAKNEDEIGLFDDVLFNPISIWKLSQEIKHIVEENIFFGEILHIAGSELMTKYKFGTELLKYLKLNLDTVKKSSIESYGDRAKRSMDQTLDCSNYQKKYKRKLPDLSETLEEIRNNYESN